VFVAINRPASNFEVETLRKAAVVRFSDDELVFCDGEAVKWYHGCFELDQRYGIELLLRDVLVKGGQCNTMSGR
jgi:hypothetical protein